MRHGFKVQVMRSRFLREEAVLLSYDATASYWKTPLHMSRPGRRSRS
jgi:hypothetical protein